jgi:hypothetical protein
MILKNINQVKKGHNVNLVDERSIRQVILIELQKDVRIVINLNLRKILKSSLIFVVNVFTIIHLKQEKQDRQ